MSRTSRVTAVLNGCSMDDVEDQGLRTTNEASLNVHVKLLKRCTRLDFHICQINILQMTEKSY